MFRNLTRISTLTFILAFCVNALAIEKVQRLKMELGGDFSFSYDNYDQLGFDQGSVTSLNLTPRFGFFIGRYFQLEPELSLSYVSIDDNSGSTDDILSFGFLLRVAQNFLPHQRTMPFVFFGIGRTENSISGLQDEPATIIFPELGMGIKAFIGRNSALRVAVKWVHEENSLAIDDLDNNALRFSAGYSVFIGR